MFVIPLLFAIAAQPANPVIPLWEGKAPHAVGDSDTDKPTPEGVPRRESPTAPRS